MTPEPDDAMIQMCSYHREELLNEIIIIIIMQLEGIFTGLPDALKLSKADQMKVKGLIQGPNSDTLAVFGI